MTTADSSIIQGDQNSCCEPCKVFGCGNIAKCRVLVRISPTAVTYAGLCDDCAVELAVTAEEIDESTDLYLGSDALDFAIDDLLDGMCCCGHTKPYHWETSCVGREEGGGRCKCRRFLP